MELDKTVDYMFMLSAFAADLCIALEDQLYIDEFKELLEEKNIRLVEDIVLLSELDFGLRSGKLKIVEVDLEENNENV